MGTSTGKAVLAFFSLASILSTHAQNLSEASVVLLNQDQTPRCQLTDNAPVEGLRQCDQDDIAYAQMFTTDSVERAGVGGRIFTALSLMGLTASNIVMSCRAVINRDGENLDEVVEDLYGVAKFGLGTSAVHTLIGTIALGPAQFVASALWGIFTLLPTGHGAYYLCHEKRDELVDLLEKYGEQLGEKIPYLMAAFPGILAPPDYKSSAYSIQGDDVSFSLSFDNVSNGHYVEVFTDAACTQRVGGALPSGERSTEVEILSLTAGTYSFYAITRTPGGDEASACTLVLENFELEENLGPALTSGVVAADMDLDAVDVGDEDDEEAVAEAVAAEETATPALAPPSYSSYDYFLVGENHAIFALFFNDVFRDDQVVIFTDAACTQAVGSGLSYAAYVEQLMRIEVFALTAGTYSFYVTTRRGDKTSACALVLENFELEGNLSFPGNIIGGVELL